MIVRGTLIPLGAGMFLVAFVCSLAVANGMGIPPRERPVPYRMIDRSAYRNFVVNWDDRRDPVLYALIQSPAQYDALFRPAAVMGSRGPFSPEASLYDSEQILVVARVLPGAGEGAFEVERIVADDRCLTFRYLFKAPASTASWVGKVYLAVRIPKHPYRRVVFVENGARVGELNAAAGQWSVPPRLSESED